MPKWLLLAFAMLGLSVPAARAAALVQEFYLPMPENQIYQALSTIQTGIGTTQSSIYSVIVTGDGTVIRLSQQLKSGATAMTLTAYPRALPTIRLACRRER